MQRLEVARGSAFLLFSDNLLVKAMKTNESSLKSPNEASNPKKRNQYLGIHFLIVGFSISHWGNSVTYTVV